MGRSLDYILDCVFLYIVFQRILIYTQVYGAGFSIRRFDRPGNSKLIASFLASNVSPGAKIRVIFRAPYNETDDKMHRGLCASGFFQGWIEQHQTLMEETDFNVTVRVNPRYIQDWMTFMVRFVKKL